MSKDNVVSLSAPAVGAIADPLTDLLRRNARRLVEVAVAAEFEVYLSAFSEERLAVGDGALGFWSALSEVYPETRGQRCWMNKSGNVLNYLPAEGEGGSA